MMNKKNSKIALMLVASAVSVALTGCGSDGDDGKDGNPGLPGGTPAEAIEQLNLEVLSVTYENDNPTIKVYATNEDDEPVVGLSSFEVKKVAQLIPAGATGAGNSAEWQSIGSQSSFTDNKNGSYNFTIETEGYNAELTQRYNLIAKAGTLLDGVTEVPHTELSQDFSGEGYDALYTKNIVSHEVCTKCHAEGEPITTRHSSYYTQETCATCHSTNLSTESQWKHLIHNIHNSNKSFTDKNDKEYTGVEAEALIQNNCQSCHVESEELTEWGNWTRIPTMETCTSCHTGIDFVAGEGHSQQSDNSNCIACHNASWTEEIHTGGFEQKKAFIDMYGLTSTLMVNSDKTATISVTITDAAGSAVDASTLVSKIQRIETITNVGPNFPIMGYNASPGNGQAKVAYDLVRNGELGENVSVEAGALQYTLPVLPFGEYSPAGIQDTDTAFTFIGLEMCNDGTAAVDCGDDIATTSMKADLVFGTLSGEAASMRHTDSVAFNTCENCHGETFEIHKGYHAGFIMTEQLGRENADGEVIVGVDGCVTCHTPDGTYASGGNQGALEMKLHSVHGEQDIISDCTQCHNDFNLDAFKLKGALATSAGEYTTPITATCASCHGFDEIKAHAEGQGGVVNGTYEDANASAQVEFCMGCHKPTIFDHTAVNM
ncbi:OmcA/MtrC family decaheme c-type cytochrome [Shewanella electrodiphila]|uniref:OmcA/MtrC family decaheme c-type cytochrome n=1 Tax=Shewanella electrodiphila TaxID=934143 RepID=A0ABT0KQQ2_9GAMM|nr:OmcA/MtrC family decaheme c-type cytochrome [Shewanella electrodiphila]MCL1046182.1 OmcA/MtrC family decaheme c-type cytochrome [Shewanella electrodiphila]